MVVFPGLKKPEDMMTVDAGSEGAAGVAGRVMAAGVTVTLERTEEDAIDMIELFDTDDCWAGGTGIGVSLGIIDPLTT